MPRRNPTPNPSAINDTAGITVAAGTLSRVTGLASPWLRTTGARLTVGSTVPSYSQIIFPYSAAASTDLSGALISATIQWSISAVPGGAFYVYIPCSDSSAAYINNAVLMTPSVTAGAVVATSLTGPAPANTRSFSVAILVYSPVANSTVTVSAARAEAINDPNMVYRDGNDTSLGWAWDGTSGSSASTKAVDDASPWVAITM